MIMNKTYPEFKTLSTEEIASYPIQAFEGSIHVIDTQEAAEKAVEYLSEKQLIGFDTETRPSFSKKQRYTVSILQLSDENHAFIFRLKKIGMPTCLASLLASKEIGKIGVAVHDDIKALRHIRDFPPGNFIELQHVAKTLEIDAMGLKRLTPIVLGFRISKRQQLSNWENESLTHAQKSYAATDAWVSLAIYKKLQPYLP